MTDRPPHDRPTPDRPMPDGPMPDCNGAGRGAGFTLLEALVAFTVLALALAGAFGAIGAGARTGGVSAAHLAALARAETALARAGVAAPLVPGLRERREGGFAERVTVTREGEQTLAQAAGFGLWRVDVEVAWDAGAVRLSGLKPGPVVLQDRP